MGGNNSSSIVEGNSTNISAVLSHALAMQQDHFGGLSPDQTFMVWNPSGVFADTLRPFVIPMLGLLVGTVMMQIKRVATVGKLVLYFGAQSFMNIYMGWVMRTSVTVPKGTEINGHILQVDLTGCPAGFALTAMQQVISFIVFICVFMGTYYTPYRYTPKKLNSNFEIGCVVLFGCVFALNIALNNFSLGYISIAVNLIIRSCLPLSTFLSQQGLAVFGLYPFNPCRSKEIMLMLVGVVCAGVFTVARILGSQAADTGKEVDAGETIMGVFMCILSLLCGSLNLALAGVLGETKLNVYDTVAYMAIPATLFLLPIAMLWEKKVPGEWPTVLGKSHMSDFEILGEVWVLNKWTVFYLFLSGIFSFMYNIVQFSIVHTLSPSATAFGGNFNKAALIFLTLLLPFLRVHELPGSPYIEVIYGAVIVNIAAFSYYSFLQIQAKMQENEKSSKLMDNEHSESEEESSEESE
eukprot:CAMPEP_0203855808 /NCGR_PEP_ID=MMETSP0359-20131031/9833_1 /ASSEMBLY_ACC=CAM_ASM_000338 /TAXON_ID=268821 /ORGANISM="Scrippsiella Hangoei, Strain SHTV-5" /LENGTH=465 /DNA_ID=CAMNT_0050772375 /DNA_START=68 /DNA_END=1465 /DNA_ORIENTATION=+